MTNVVLYPHTVAELMLDGFTGWMYTLDEAGPVAAVTHKNNALDQSEIATPHACLEAALTKNRESMGIVKLHVGTNATSLSTFFSELYNGGNGIFKGSVGSELLVPVVVSVRDASVPDGVIPCELSSYVSKTPEYFMAQDNLMAKIQTRIKGCTKFAATSSPPASFLAQAHRSQQSMAQVLKMFTGPTAIETLIRSRPDLHRTVGAAIRHIASYTNLFSDSGTTFKDPMAQRLAEAAINQSITEIVQSGSP